MMEALAVIGAIAAVMLFSISVSLFAALWFEIRERRRGE